ncbi:MAG TPA: RNA polymerase sigma-70 factor [Puia sp.]|jgi:RNA polymerase sigma-70 factor (ECF subfamily)|nr:RNA polymerase sigma-70 factor [Puia sp.]
MDSLSPDTERALLDRVADGDQQAFTRLFQEYSDITFGFAFAYTKLHESAEEVVQEVYLKIWLRREKLREIQSFKDHLFIITRNHLIDYLRKNLREQQYRQQLVRHFKDSAITPHEELLLKESQARIGKAVELLPPQQQTIYRLRRQEGLPLTEIALKMNISRLTVRNHLNKALGAIREYLQG